jgi:hypothetical protein
VSCFESQKYNAERQKGETIMKKNEMLELAAIISEAVINALKETPTSGNQKKEIKARGNAKTEELKKTETKELKKYSTSLKDYAPKKGNDGHYKWGRKTDTVKSGNYLAMQKAYCYAVATKGKAISSDECYKLGIEVDYSNAYNKAKEDFKKKYVYVAKEKRD